MNKKIVIGLFIAIVFVAGSLIFIKSEEKNVLNNISQSAAVINVSMKPSKTVTNWFTCWLYGGTWREYQGYNKTTWDCDWAIKNPGTTTTQSATK